MKRWFIVTDKESLQCIFVSYHSKISKLLLRYEGKTITLNCDSDAYFQAKGGMLTPVKALSKKGDKYCKIIFTDL